MKKITLISIIIITLGGVGYYLYLTDSLNFDFLKKGEIEQLSVNTEGQQTDVKNYETIAVEKINTLVVSLDAIKDFEVKYLGPEDIWGYTPSASNVEAVGYFKDESVYKISRTAAGNYAINVVDYYIQDNYLFYVYQKMLSHSGKDETEIKYYFNKDGTLLKSDVLKQSKELDPDTADEVVKDYKDYLQKFAKVKQIAQISNQSIEGVWYVKRFEYSCTKVCALTDDEAGQWINKILKINGASLKFDFANIPMYKNEKSSCNILNLNNPEIVVDDYPTIYAYKMYKTDCVDHPFTNFSLYKNGEIEINRDGVNFFLSRDKSVAEYETPVPPKTNTTTTYMCGGKVKIVREQDSPSLPPRVSYVRVSDGAGIASYGDFGAYIRPEYFSIDRAQIEEGYSFNETNFCKYLKN